MAVYPGIFKKATAGHQDIRKVGTLKISSGIRMPCCGSFVYKRAKSHLSEAY